MLYLIRFSQVHQSFRKPETEALAQLHNIKIEFVHYEDTSPFCIVKLDSEEDARKLIARSILGHAIYELWGSGTTYGNLHEAVQRNSSHLWPTYATCSFKFTLDAFSGKRTMAEQLTIIDSFEYTGFEGPLRMKNPDLEMCIFEDYDLDTPTPKVIHLGRYLATGNRRAITDFDLKKRAYISTTSMDAELTLITANMSHARSGTIFFDPFMGTASFPIACAHFGAHVFGSDIDGRSIRGKPNRNVVTNFEQYNLTSNYLDGLISDLTNTPLRIRLGGVLDGIVCDPPYGVREGLKVLGSPNPRLQKEVILRNGMPAHLQHDYVPPKMAYSFEAMLDDILEFAARMLVENGRLAMWMPTANEDEKELEIPSHPCLQLLNISIQPFNKWSRRLLTYRRLPEAEVDPNIQRKQRTYPVGRTADDLNAFRRNYFTSSKPPNDDKGHTHASK